MILAMDLAVCVICGGENGTNGCHLADFSEDIAFACHFVATCLPPALPPCRSVTGISYNSKKLYKMASYSASYSLNSWLIDKL